jgi:valyl-tRNA synthetase
LRALHPLMPFITEEIWQQTRALSGRTGPTIMLEPWPVADAAARDAGVDSEMRWVMDLILAVRQIRGEMDISPSRRFEVLLVNASAADLARLGRTRHWVERLANLTALRPLEDGAAEPESAVALMGEMRILVPMAGLIDVAAEIGRLEKRIAKLRSDLGKTEAKLSNSNFVANAPATVVEQERTRIADFSRELAGLEAQLERVRKLQ